ncbi:hypothetical protein DK846_00710 [Methanospirillum lacunae]|uniref:Uncharacterized protein n=2 Tax=Methanospirillum lacunae TaxID=668570 RepID=A0A2V2NBK5_9EURY|nr:hypothetical protein DK846_00710 [Methanospirillum lacunae]
MGSRQIQHHQSSCGVVALHRGDECNGFEGNRLDQSLKEAVIYGSAIYFTRNHPCCPDVTVQGEPIYNSRY